VIGAAGTSNWGTKKAKVFVGGKTRKRRNNRVAESQLYEEIIELGKTLIQFKR